MKKLKLTLPLFALILSACQFVPIGSSSESSGESITSENNSHPTSDISTSTTTSEDPGTSVELPITSEVPTNPELQMYNGFNYPNGAQTKVTDLYYEFWHPNTKVEFEISAEASIFNYMDLYGDGNNDDIFYQGTTQSRNLNDLYWPVNVTIKVNGTAHTFDEVGMRRKGNTSRNYFFMTDNAVSDAFNFKLSFNEVWDDPIYEVFGLKKSWTKADPAYVLRDDRTFLADSNGKFGMDKLDIKMYKTEDNSLINQPFAFSLFQRYGLISPNSTLGTIKIASSGVTRNMGVVTINETNDKDLIKRYFSKANATGDLYKVGWGQGSQWGDWDKGNLKYEQYQNYPSMIGEEDKFNNYSPRYDAKEFKKYADAEKTILNTPEVAHANLINLMKVLSQNSGKTVAQYITAISDVVDINSFLMFGALSYLTGNEDDLRNNGNNYYIYFNPGQNNKAYFIPYDYDWALGLGWNDNGGLTMADLSPFHDTLQGNDRNRQDNRLWYYTVINRKEVFNITMNKDWRNTYLSYIKTIRHGDYFNPTKFNELYQLYYNNYKNDTNVLKHNEQAIYNTFAGTGLFQEYFNRITTSIDKEAYI